MGWLAGMLPAWGISFNGHEFWLHRCRLVFCNPCIFFFCPPSFRSLGVWALEKLTSVWFLFLWCPMEKKVLCFYCDK